MLILLKRLKLTLKSNKNETCAIYSPGALTVSLPTLAAILSESFPPSIAIPSCDIVLHISTQVS